MKTLIHNRTPCDSLLALYLNVFDHLPPTFKLIHEDKVIDGLDTVCWFAVSAEGLSCTMENILPIQFPVSLSYLLSYSNKFEDLFIAILFMNRTQRMVLSFSSEESN